MSGTPRRFSEPLRESQRRLKGTQNDLKDPKILILGFPKIPRADTSVPRSGSTELRVPGTGSRDLESGGSQVKVPIRHCKEKEIFSN